MTIKGVVVNAVIELDPSIGHIAIRSLGRSGVNRLLSVYAGFVAHSIASYRFWVSRMGLEVKASLQRVVDPPTLWAGLLPIQSAAMGQEAAAAASVAAVGPLPKEAVMGASAIPATHPTQPPLDRALLRESVQIQNVQCHLDPERMAHSSTPLRRP